MKIILNAILLVMTIPAVCFGQVSSFDSLLEFAKKGDAKAQNDLGIKYAEGDGIKRDDKLGVYWFKKSAEQGNVFGACNLGLHYGWGTGVRRNAMMAMKWSFISNSLDSLKCNPGDFAELFKPNKRQVEAAWELAEAWLRAHPDLDNNFGQRPWLDPKQEYPITVRERGSTIKLPLKNSKRRRGKRSQG